MRESVFRGNFTLPWTCRKSNRLRSSKVPNNFWKLHWKKYVLGNPLVHNVYYTYDKTTRKLRLADSPSYFAYSRSRAIFENYVCSSWQWSMYTASAQYISMLSTHRLIRYGSILARAISVLSYIWLRLILWSTRFCTGIICKKPIPSKRLIDY